MHDWSIESEVGVLLCPCAEQAGIKHSTTSAYSITSYFEKTSAGFTIHSPFSPLCPSSQIHLPFDCCDISSKGVGLKQPTHTWCATASVASPWLSREVLANTRLEARWYKTCWVTKEFIMIREDSSVSDFSRRRSSSIMSDFVWKKQEYIREHSHRPVYTRRVMVIYSGGTLGMMYKEGQGQRTFCDWLRMVTCRDSWVDRTLKSCMSTDTWCLW